MVTTTGQGSMIDRMIRAAKLDPQVYEEVEHDQSATSQAMMVVVLGVIAAGIGALSGGLNAFFATFVIALVGWAVYAYVAYWVGTTFFKVPETSADWGELLRTLGFASSPRVLLFLGIIPVVGDLIWPVVFIWWVIATVIAVRQALDFDTWRAIGTAVVSVVPTLVVLSVVAALVL
jgi:membrane protein implicated in regulation of membrane protease activity